jgi:hypothetical protein
VSYSNLKDPCPPSLGNRPAGETLAQRAVLCCAVREEKGAHLESELIDALENPQKTIPVKMIPLGQCGRGTSACNIPRYVFKHHCGIHTSVGKTAFLKSCANIPSHVDDLLVRLSKSLLLNEHAMTVPWCGDRHTP